jgi:hypothetical protein
MMGLGAQRVVKVEMLPVKRFAVGDTVSLRLNLRVGSGQKRAWKALRAPC